MKKCRCGETIPGGYDVEFCFHCRREHDLRKTGKIDPIHILPPCVPRILLRDMKHDSELLIPLDKGMKKRDQSFFLYGKAGRGKSYQAALLMYKVFIEMLRDGSPCPEIHMHWMNVPEFLFELRMSFRGKQKPMDEERAFRGLSTVEWLCIDDLGAERTTDWTMSSMYLIINKRYEEGRTTIITSNLDLDGLAEKMGDDRLPSRIVGMCDPVELDGEDWRLKE